MPQTLETTEPTVPGATGADGAVPPPDGARRVYRALMILAPLSLALAVAVNWLWAPEARQALPGQGLTSAEATGIPGVPEAELEKPAIELLPARVLTYEVITHQSIPGYGATAAEAVYKTLNMNLEAQIAMTVYARVEGFGSAANAQARVDQLMAPYSTNQKQAMLNGVTATTQGESPDGGVWAVGWVHGNYATFVKSSFADWIPAERRVDLLSNLAAPVVDAVDVYQRTGREGVSK